MIKKLIGIIVAVAVIAIIVIVVLRRDNFRSMVLRGEQPDAPVAAAVVAELDVPAEGVPASGSQNSDPAGTVDSLTVVVTDSI